MRWKQKWMQPFDLHALSETRPYLMGIATIWVALYHCKYLNLFDSPFLTATRLLGVVTRLKTIGNCGVDLFLLLSGLGLYFSYTRLLESDPHPVRTFYRRRFRRILPAVLIVTVITYGLTGTKDLAGWASQVFLYGFLTPTLEGGNFWYFSFLLVLYLSYPVIHRLLSGKRGYAGAFAIALGSAALAVVLSSAAEGYFYSRGSLMICRIPVFLLGACMGKQCLRHQKISGLIPLAAIPASILLILLTNDVPMLAQSYGRYYAYCVLAASIALGHAWVFSKLKKRGLLTRGVMLIGSYSMEIYLLFESIYNNGVSVFHSPDPAGAVYALTVFTAALVLAALLKAVMKQLEQETGRIIPAVQRNRSRE